MGLKDIIDGTGRGFWFGYGRFLGVHWGRPSTQDVIEVTADPFYCEEEFRQLVTEPDRRHGSRWQGWGLESKGRILTDEEKQGIIETLFEKAMGYEGVAKRRMFQKLINNKRFAGNQRVEDFCVSAVNAGELETELLMKNMGSRVLAQVEPSISTPYLERKFKDKKGNSYERKWFMERVLEGLGIVYFGKDAVHTSENIVPWIPLVIYAIEEGAINPEYYKDRIGDFFNGFPYEPAIPHLFVALESDVRVKGKEISSRVLRSHQGNKDVGEVGCWRGAWEGYVPVLREEIEYTFEPIYVIAEGAKKSLLSLSDSRADLKPRILPALQKYDSKPKSNVIEVNEKETEIGETVVTYSDYEGR